MSNDRPRMLRLTAVNLRPMGLRFAPPLPLFARNGQSAGTVLFARTGLGTDTGLSAGLELFAGIGLLASTGLGAGIRLSADPGLFRRYQTDYPY